MTLHGATRRRILREQLNVTQVMTTVQMGRQDLMPAHGPLPFPHRTYTVATRTTQQTSQQDITFVSLNEDILSRHSPSELGHLAGLAETCLLLGDDPILQATGLTLAHDWRLVQPGERRQGDRREGRLGHLPDAEIFRPDRPGPDWAVEMDAGYPRQRMQEKMRGFAQQRYAHILWATSVHGRVTRAVDLMQQLHDAGHLPGVVSGAALYVDYWSARDPYRPERRCHTKKLFTHRVF